ncbi:Aste57867_16509 [Aphanomyces stellatus]|uniref:Aste57867_16509 protein n=1 Tax=Aphanomyces stellatus TaxID=120398 RepID=A0A485L7I2_9STRA|nr:hypothetical protein As57867_016452 [Aphanomyces stellatus]VFT93283.1 Aste57867_16509 [Aphanomyces stellatus]
MRPAFEFERRMLDMDWRLVEAFDLINVDTVLLQEMVPTLTYALVTEANCTSPHLTCKLICILQLVVETFIACRKSDAYDTHLLREDLIATSNERDTYRMRLKEAKTDVKALKTQLARSSTLLRSCSHVLHAHGCSPHAIAALEAMLATSSDMQPSSDTATAQKVAHLCAFCGKAFSTQEFLVKHIERRHANDVPKAPVVEPDSEPPQAMLLSKLELLLAQHEASMRQAASSEVDALKHLESELAVERGIVAELKATRTEIQSKLDAVQRLLAVAEYERDGALKHVAVLNATLRACEDKAKMESTVKPVPSGGDARDQLVIQKLEAALVQTQAALAAARGEMEEKYNALVAAYEALKQHKANAATVVVSASAVDASTQTDPAAPLRSMASQAEIIATLESSPRVSHFLHPTAAAAAGPRMEHNSTQTDGTLKALESAPPRMQSVEVQTTDVPVERIVVADPSTMSTAATPAPENAIPHVKAKAGLPALVEQKMVEMTPKVLSPTPVPLPHLSDVVPENIYPPVVRVPPELIHSHVNTAVQLATLRAERYATGRNDFPSSITPLAQRPFLKSMWPHGEDALNESMVVHLHKLESNMEKYGAGEKPLSEAQHADAVKAFTRHLRALPLKVLERMVKVESQVHRLLETEWLPAEKNRRELLENIKARLDLHEREQDHWVSQIIKAKARVDESTAPSDPTNAMLGCGEAFQPAKPKSVQNDTPRDLEEPKMDEAQNIPPTFPSVAEVPPMEAVQSTPNVVTISPEQTTDTVEDAISSPLPPATEAIATSVDECEDDIEQTSRLASSRISPKSAESTTATTPDVLKDKPPGAVLVGPAKATPSTSPYLAETNVDAAGLSPFEARDDCTPTMSVESEPLVARERGERDQPAIETERVETHGAAPPVLQVTVRRSNDEVESEASITNDDRMAQSSEFGASSLGESDARSSIHASVDMSMASLTDAKAGVVHAVDSDSDVEEMQLEDDCPPSKDARHVPSELMEEKQEVKIGLQSPPRESESEATDSPPRPTLTPIDTSQPHIDVGRNADVDAPVAFDGSSDDDTKPVAVIKTTRESVKSKIFSPTFSSGFSTHAHGRDRYADDERRRHGSAPRGEARMTDQGLVDDEEDGLVEEILSP